MSLLLLSPHSPLSNISFIHLSSQNFCGRNDRLVQQNFSITTQLLSILLPHIRVIHCPLLGLCCCCWYCACGRFIEHSAFLHHKEKLPMTCKSRGFGAACLRNGMRTGCTGQGWGAGLLQQQVLGEREGVSYPKQMEDNPISCASIKAFRSGWQGIRERWAPDPLQDTSMSSLHTHRWS